MYLGILLNPGLINMIKDHSDPLRQKIQLLFKSWDKILISLWGHVQVIKMIIAPRLSYPICMLPLNIPASILKSIVKMDVVGQNSYSETWQTAGHNVGN